jgi:ribosomal protein L13
VRIESLKRYQRPRGQTPFATLSPSQRATAEGHYQRLCTRSGEDLPQWRRAILAGRAKDLVLRPRNGAWARRLRAGHKPRADTSALNAVTTTCVESTAVTTDAAKANSYHADYRGYTEKVPSTLDEFPSTRTPEAVLRLDVRGVTSSGSDGADTAQRILHALSQAIDNSPHFSVAVPEKDLPKQWAWRLDVVAVP